MTDPCRHLGQACTSMSLVSLAWELCSTLPSEKVLRRIVLPPSIMITLRPKVTEQSVRLKVTHENVVCSAVRALTVDI